MATIHSADLCARWCHETPCALGPAGRWLALVLLSSGASVSGVAGWVIGAWPVFVYAGFEIAVLAWAFWWVGRRGQEREEILVAGDCVTVTTESEHRKVVVRTLNREWATLVVRERGVRFELWLRYCGRLIPLAQMATDSERQRLSGDLAQYMRVERQ